MMFYEKAVPVSRRRHAGCSVEVRDYGFCRKVNSVPLMALEFARAAGEYPVVFAGEAGSMRPVVVLGLRAGENLLVSDAGAWLGRYIPAFVRRYPFVFSTDADDQRFVLCVDEAFTGFNREGRGESLFAEGGEPSTYVGRVLRFLQEYRAQFVRTQSFCRRLEELELLEPMQARVSLGESKLSLGGFSTVSKEKLKALPGDALASLAASDQLELLYLHLHSLRNFESLRQRLAQQAPAQGELPGLAADATGAPVTLH
jgi:hypothetical protein